MRNFVQQHRSGQHLLLTQQRKLLLDILNDMCVRGETTVDEFVARAEKLCRRILQLARRVESW